MTSRHLYTPAGRYLAFLWRTKDLVSWPLSLWPWHSSSLYEFSCLWILRKTFGKKARNRARWLQDGRMFTEEGTHKGHGTDTEEKWLQGSRGQVSGQLLKARLPMLFTELIPLDKEGKGPREGNRLIVSTKLLNILWMLLYDRENGYVNSIDICNVQKPASW